MNGPAPVMPVIPGQQQKTNGLAIASLILGIGSIFLSFVIGIVAIILGGVSLGQISHKNEGGKGMAITGIVLGALSLILIPVFIIVILRLLGPQIGNVFSQINQSLSATY